MTLEGTELSARLVDLVLSNIADGVFTVDPDFRITFLNKSAEQITGFRSQDTLGKPCHEVFCTPMCGKDCPLRRSIRTGKTVTNIEIDIRTNSGRLQTINVSTAPLVDANGQFLGGVETFRDVTDLKQLRREISQGYTTHDVVSKNHSLRQVLDTLPNVARSDAPILIQGASGTGKDLLARAVHNSSARQDSPFVKVSCSALPEALLDVDLFGDSGQHNSGCLQVAPAGTLVLDEISELPIKLQAKLVRALELAANGSCAADRSQVPRVVALSSRDLDQAVAQGGFRNDLYYRLNVIQLRLPELRDRREDVPLLVEHFLQRFQRRMGRDIVCLSDDAMAALMRYAFPGNVRELENALEHAYVVAKGPLIHSLDLPTHVTQSRRQTQPRRRMGRRGSFCPPQDKAAERRHVLEVLERNAWSVPRAAEELGMHRTTLWRRMRRLGLQPN